jgi:hypothetical protein
MPIAFPWPVGLTRVAVRCCPPSLREDAMQEAWLATLEGRKPDSAVRQLARREARLSAMQVDMDHCPPAAVRHRF